MSGKEYVRFAAGIEQFGVFRSFVQLGFESVDLSEQVGELDGGVDLTYGDRRRRYFAGTRLDDCLITVDPPITQRQKNKGRYADGRR